MKNKIDYDIQTKEIIMKDKKPMKKKEDKKMPKKK